MPRRDRADLIIFGPPTLVGVLLVTGVLMALGALDGVTRWWR